MSTTYLKPNNQPNKKPLVYIYYAFKLNKSQILTSTIYFHPEPKIKPNKTTINILNIKAQVNTGQKKWGKGINLQSNKTITENINKFIKFKILEYKAYNFKDNKL